MSERVKQSRMQKADFKGFYEKHIDRVYRFVYFRVKNNTEVAEDLTSEIFTKALKAFAKYDPEKSETAWIMTIARNHLINHWRDQKEQIDIEDVKYHLEGSDARIDEVIEDDKRRLYVSLNELSRKNRELVELKYIQGYRYKEIGEVLGKTAGAVRVESHRAMKKLKTIMKKYEPLK